MYAPLYVMIGFQSPQAEKLDNVKLGGDRGVHTWVRDWLKHRRNMGWCKVSSIHCSDKKVVSVPIRNRIFWGSTIWESTIWESTIWGHQFWIWGPTNWTGSLPSGSLLPGSLQSGLNNLGSGNTLTGLGTFSLGVCNLGVSSLGSPILDPGIQPMDWKSTVWESTGTCGAHTVDARWTHGGHTVDTTMDTTMDTGKTQYI